jgi:hypothetical protein
MYPVDIVDTIHKMQNMVKGTDGFPYAEPPEHYKTAKEIECLKGTRWWVQKGSPGAFRLWLYELIDDEEYKERVIPLQWVPEFVGVTRAAVHKRAKAGKLTVFSFVMMEPEKVFLTKARLHARSRYDFAVMSECEAWSDLLMAEFDRKVDARGGWDAYMHDRLRKQEKIRKQARLRKK